MADKPAIDVDDATVGEGHHGLVRPRRVVWSKQTPSLPLRTRIVARSSVVNLWQQWCIVQPQVDRQLSIMHAAEAEFDVTVRPVSQVNMIKEDPVCLVPCIARDTTKGHQCVCGRIRNDTVEDMGHCVPVENGVAGRKLDGYGPRRLF